CSRSRSTAGGSAITPRRRRRATSCSTSSCSASTATCGWIRGCSQSAGRCRSRAERMRESKKRKAERALRIMDALEEAMPDARIELDYRTPVDLLVAVILSAQCTDRRVNMVTPALFARYPTPADYARAEPE